MRPSKTYQKLQELILKSEEKTLEDELGFGCRLEELSSGRQLRMLEDLGNNILCFKEGYSLDKTTIPFKHSLEILGQDITLERVMVALGAKEISFMDFCRKKEGYLISEELGEILELWTLTLPAHQQSEETQVKLIEILS